MAAGAGTRQALGAAMMGPPMLRRYCTETLSATLLIFAVVHSACAAEGQLRPFSTDGCSLFPDRSLISKADWCQCCVAHDLAYWRGGTSQARLSADKALSTCVLRVTANKALADLMYAGVRTGGGPHFYTPYRWGYGWPFGRPYRELTPEEEAKASALEREYRATNPSLACTK